MKNVLIFGASGHGSVVLDCLERSKEYRPVGFVDSNILKGTKKFGYEVLGTENELPILMERFNIEGGIVAVGDNWSRRQFVTKIVSISPRLPFITAIHPSAILGKNAEVGKGSAILPGVIVNANSVIGDHCILNTRASLDHDSIMYNFTSLAPGVCTGGNVILGEGSAICLGARIIENISIGHYSVIGSNSLVLKDIPSKVLAYGNPARVIRKRMEWEPYLHWKRSAHPKQLRLDYTGS
jgi:sugar O-acyltransferase (sialic acid O-acetyltransferase NeuD family)